MIISAGIVISAIILASGLKSFGKSIEVSAKAIQHGLTSQRTSVPSSFRINLGEIQIGNGGGGGESFRIQTSNSET